MSSGGEKQSRENSRSHGATAAPLDDKRIMGAAIGVVGLTALRNR
jgi:hypothetical protein